MGSIPRLAFCAVFGLCCLSSAAISCAQAVQDRGESLEFILAAVTAPSLPALKVAEESWKRAEGQEAEVLVKYAMTLAYIRNNLPTKGFALLESIPPEVRRAGPLRRCHVWLLVRLRKDDQAQERLEIWLAEISTKRNATPTPSDLEDVTFLGRLLAYLEQVAAREPPVSPEQAANWRRTLEGLPKAWNQQLPAEATLIAEEQRERTEAVKQEHNAWYEKTSQERAGLVDRIDTLRRAQREISGRLEPVRTAHAAFVAQHQARITELEALAAPLYIRRNSLRKPRRPGERSTAGLKGEELRRAERENKERDDEYDDDLKEYERERAEIARLLAPIEREANPLYAQDRAMRKEIETGAKALKNVENPLAGLVIIEERQSTQLAERSTWDAPANLDKIRLLDGYSVLSFTAEVARIRRVMR